VDCLCRATDYGQRTLRSRKLTHGSETTTTNLAIYRKPSLIVQFLDNLARFLSDSRLACLALLGDEIAIHNLPCRKQYPLPMRRNSTGSRWHYIQSTWRGNTSVLLNRADYNLASRKNKPDIASDPWGVVCVYRLVVVFA
jgi:hypothetical protein